MAASLSEVAATMPNVNVFDIEPFVDLLPRRVVRWLGTGLVVFAILFPSTFQRWYLGQVEDYARELTAIVTSTLVPAVDPPSPAPPSGARPNT